MRRGHRHKQLDNVSKVASCDVALQDPLSGRTQWTLVGLLYAVLTLAFRWPAVTPCRLCQHVQSLDSALTAAITHHTARSLVGLESFWNFGAFYPHSDTLCLSEPMITS